MMLRTVQGAEFNNYKPEEFLFSARVCASVSVCRWIVTIIGFWSKPLQPKQIGLKERKKKKTNPRSNIWCDDTNICEQTSEIGREIYK